MLRIRLQRSGRKNRANYRVVVAEHSAPIKGRYLELLGTFDPLVEKHGLVIDTAKVEEWVKKGARPTNTVARLLKAQGVKGMEPFIIEMKDRKVKNPKEEPEAPAAPAAPVAEAAPAKEAPKEEEKPAEEPAAEEPKEDTPQDSEESAGEAKEDDTAEKADESEGEEKTDENK